MMNPLIASDADRPVYDVLGDRYTLLLSAEETGGAYSLFVFEVPTGRGPPPHIHSREDESFYVMSGEVDFTINGKKTRARAGDVIFGPRDIPHSFTGASEVPARMICLASPGGFEKFFGAAGAIVTDKSSPPAPPTDDAVRRLLDVAPLYGLTMLPPA